MATTLMSSNPRSSMQERIAADIALLETWSPFTSHIEDKSTRAYVSRLLENQRNQIDTLSGGMLMEATTVTADVAQFKKYAYPLITLVHPTISIKDVVSMQPLMGPTGTIYTFASKYASAKGQTAAGTEVTRNPDRYYASPIIDTEEARAAAGASTNYDCNLAWFPVVPGTLTVVVDPDGTPITGTDDGAGSITGAGISSGSIVYNTGAITLTLCATNTEKMVATYQFNSEGNTQQPEMNFEITAQPVTVSDRTLRAKYTIQALQDMLSQHGVEGDRIFTERMASEIQREISQDVFQQLLASATDTGIAFSKVRPDYISYEDHKQQLIDKLTEISTRIYNDTYRGFGNVIVTGSTGINIIRTFKQFRPSSMEVLKLPIGNMGTLNNMWTIIYDPLIGADNLFVGYKGADFTDTGAVFSPYALTLTDALLNPDDMKIRKGILSRDAFTITDSKFYAKMTFTT